MVNEKTIRATHVLRVLRKFETACRDRYSTKVKGRVKGENGIIAGLTVTDIVNNLLEHAEVEANRLRLSWYTVV